jgi:hypothetical protein
LATHASPEPEPLVEKAGTACWWNDPDEPDVFVVSVRIGTGPMSELDLDETFTTEGQALDGLLKWAKDRNLRVVTPARLELTRLTPAGVAVHEQWLAMQAEAELVDEEED